MKKAIPLLTLGTVFLASCTLFHGGDEFSTLYRAHVQAEIRQIDAITDALGLQRKEHTEWDIETSLTIPLLFSGTLNSKYDIKAFERNADIRFTDFGLNYESLMGTGGIQAKELGLISHEGDAYFLLQWLRDTPLLTAEMMNVFKNYDGKWLSWTRDDAMKSLSGASAEEVLATTIVNNLSKMKLSDIENYLTKNIIWKPTGKATQSGSLVLYPVDLDRDAIIALVTSVNQDLTGSGISDQEKGDLRTALDSIVFVGTLALDRDDASRSMLDATVSQSGGTVIAKIAINQSRENLGIKLDSIPTGAVIDLNLSSTKDEFRGNMALTQSWIEMGKVNLNAQFDDAMLKALNLELSGQGIAVQLVHKRSDDGKFDGNLQLPLGAMSWNGTMDGKKLTGLSVKWALQWGALTMNLSQSGGELKGPMILKNGDQTAFQANVRLLVESGKFALGVDVLDETGTGSMLSFGTRLNYTISPYEKNIKSPSPTTPLQSFIDALNAVVPAPIDSPEFDTNTLGTGELNMANPPSISN